jgi:hypothetical protein
MFQNRRTNSPFALTTYSSDSAGLEVELLASGVRLDFINTSFALDEFGNAWADPREELEE